MQLVEQSAVADPAEDEVSSPSGIEKVPSVIQFSAPLYLCAEADGQLVAHVLRIGDATQKASVRYTTVDASAKAGHKYEHKSGTLIFEPGDIVKDICVPLYQDERWDATLEFQLTLDNAKGAQLGLYLNTCRAKILDDDYYPTNKHTSRAPLTSFKLMKEYIRMNLDDPVIWSSTLKHVALDLYKGLYFFLTLYLQIYLVDVVLAPSEERETSHHHGGAEEAEEEPTETRLLLGGIHVAARVLGRMLKEEAEGEEEEPTFAMPHELIIPHHRRMTAVVIAALYIVPFALVHVCDVMRTQLKIPYEARKTTQASLLTKFLNYKDSARVTINVGEITMTMMRDAVEVCDFGYMKMLSVIGIWIKLVFALVFILSENRLAVIPLIAYPLVLGAFLVCRERMTIRVFEHKAKQQNHMVQVVNDAVSNYRLIADFLLRPNIVDNYARAIDDYHKHEKECARLITNSMYMARWLTTLLVGAWMVFGSFKVTTVGGTITLGAFLATINVFKEVGMEMQEIYSECMEIQRSFGPLEKIAYYMNLETDLQDKFRVSKEQHVHGHREHMMARQKVTVREGLKMPKGDVDFCASHPAFVVDTIPIMIKNLTYNHEKHLVCSNLSAEFHQGGLYAIVGPAHHGKGTLLKLLGQVLLPSEGSGEVFTPPHIRVLHLSQCECLLNDNLLQNILLYTPEQKVLGGRERVRKICRYLGFQEHVLKYLDLPDSLMKEWAPMLTHTDHSRLQLARAFVMNPECLVMHKPDMVFGPDEVGQIMRLIRQHVNERGIELPPEGRQFRRPRTVFYTCATLAGLNAADLVFEVKQDGSAQVRNPLKFKIVSAKGLPSFVIGGLSDPYCICELVGKPRTRVRSPTIFKSLNPVWNFNVEFDHFTEDDAIKFSIYDADDLKDDDFMAIQSIHSKDLLHGGRSQEILLTSAKQGTKATLKIEIVSDLSNIMRVVPTSTFHAVQSEIARAPGHFA